MSQSLKFSQALWRGFKKYCPRCGEGKIFDGFFKTRQNCPHCNLEFIHDGIDVLVFMYVSTAFITGIILALMVWVFPAPQNPWLGRILMLVVALAAMALTTPRRKGIAIAIDYWTTQKWG